MAQGCLSDVRQKILEISEPCSDDDQLVKLFLEQMRHLHQARHTDERIFRRLVSVRWRIERRALNMWTVIRRARGNVYQSNFQFLEQRKKSRCFGHVGLSRVLRVHAKTPSIRDQRVVFFWNALSQ